MAQSWLVVALACKHSTQEYLEAGRLSEDCQKFEASLGYKASARPAWMDYIDSERRWGRREDGLIV